MKDVNKILDNLSAEWASDMINTKKKIAILIEENERLKEENAELKEKGKEEDI